MPHPWGRVEVSPPLPDEVLTLRDNIARWKDELKQACEDHTDLQSDLWDLEDTIRDLEKLIEQAETRVVDEGWSPEHDAPSLPLWES